VNYEIIHSPNTIDMENKKNHTWFWIITVLIAIFVLIFIFQNRELVSFSFIGLKIEGYGFLVFLVIFLLGFFSGWLWEFLRCRKKEKHTKRTDKDIHYVNDQHKSSPDSR
jgi:uncharacterized integral membrane protein